MSIIGELRELGLNFGSPVTKAPAGVLDGQDNRRHGESPEVLAGRNQGTDSQSRRKPAGSVSKQTDSSSPVKKPEARLDKARNSG